MIARVSCLVKWLSKSTKRVMTCKGLNVRTYVSTVFAPHSTYYCYPCLEKNNIEPVNITETRYSIKVRGSNNTCCNLHTPIHDITRVVYVYNDAIKAIHGVTKYPSSFNHSFICFFVCENV